MSDVNPVDHLTRLFGSQEKLGAAAGGVGQTAVSNWRIAGRVPSKRQLILLENAHRYGVTLSPEDFFPPKQNVTRETSA